METDDFIREIEALDVTERGFPSPGILAMLTEGIERLGAGSDPEAAKKAHAAHAALDGVFTRMASRACAGTIKAVFDGGGDQDTRMAYAMGAFDMARKLAARTHEARLEGDTAPPGP